jgi:hypothetical protein
LNENSKETSKVQITKTTLRRIINEELNAVLEGSAFGPNHYCVHHGGVHHEGKIHMAEAVYHNYDKKLRRVTHYDMKLKDGTILENVPAEDIQVTEASLANEHMHSVGKRDEDPMSAVADYDASKKPHGDGVIFDLDAMRAATARFVELLRDLDTDELQTLKDVLTPEHPLYDEVALANIRLARIARGAEEP